MPDRRYPFIDYGDDQAVADYAASLPPRLPVAPPTISDEQLTMQQLNRENAPLEWFPAVKESVGTAAKMARGEVPFASAQEVYNRLTGSGGQERYQTWPEQLVRSGFSLPADVYSGRVPTRDPLTGRTSQKMIERAQDLSGLMGGGSFAGVGARGVEPNTLGVVPVPKAKSLNIQRSVPSETLKMAAENTPGASIDAEGDLIVNVGRKQQPNQEMAKSVRGGVFYLPAGDRNFRHYGTAKSNYGGQQKIEGETAFLNPLTVRGATGGKAPEAAYTQLMGKDGFKQLDRDVMDIVSANSRMRKKDPGAFDELVQRFFNTHAPELGDLSGHILEHSTQGNQLKYALQEAAIGSAVRNAGHDGIIGYSTKRGAESGKPFISEIFDVREDRYPSPSGEYSLHPQFLSDTSANAPISALAKPAFYSALEHAVGNSKMPKANAEQWLGYLRNQPGVKQEELDFVLHDLPKGQITKPELEQYVQQHKVELKETSLGENKMTTNWAPMIDWFRPVVMNIETVKDIQDARHFNAHFKETFKSWSDEELLKDIQEYKKLPYTKFEGPSKYSQWQLPGGENYREMLLTLPSKDKIMTAEQMRQFNDADPGTPEYHRLADIARNMTQPTFQSAHWNEPNVLVHIRTNERNIPGVGNSLHVEELQSDWHQKGRKEGYKGEKEALQPKFDAIEKKIMDSNDETILADPEIDSALKKAADKKLITADEAKTYKRYTSIESGSPVPDAPFKLSWTDLALKRIIVQAAREGKDAISWTPGEAQAARYDLSKHVDRLQYYPNRKQLVGHDKNGRKVVEEMPIEPNKLADYIGKEAAEKLLKTPVETRFGPNPASDYHLLEGADLKIGGEGTKAYYNKMMVDKLNAITKKFGGKVEQANLGDTNPKGWHITPPDQTVSGKWMVKSNDYNSKGFHFDTEAEARANLEQQIAGERTPKQPIYVLRITPELRDVALNKGFSLFADTGKVGAPLAALSRVEHNPFKLGEMEKQHGVKMTPVEGNPFTATAFHGSPNPLQGERIRPMSGIGIIEKGDKFVVRDKVNDKQIGPEFNTAEDAHNFVDKNKLADFYSTANPRLAQDYATQNVHGKGPNITPLRLDIRDYHTVDAKSQPWDAINQFAINEANQLGKKGVIIKNVFDDADPMRNSRGPQTVYITLDPSTVRSKFAKFDPTKYGESGLLKADSGKVGASLAALSKEWEGKGVRNFIAQQSDAVGGNIKLHDLVVPKENRGQGIGSEFMSNLTKLADEAGKKIVLTAAKDYGATSLDRLKKFYKQFGFVENKGRNKDFRISDNMYRDPKANVGELLKAGGLPIYMDKDGNRLLPTHTQAEYERMGETKAAEWLAFSRNYPKINAPLTAAWIAQWPMMEHLLKEDINRQLKNGVESSAIKFDKDSIGNMFDIVSNLNKKFGNKTLVPHEGNPFSVANKRD